jgi:hypothetical protein
MILGKGCKGDKASKVSKYETNLDHGYKKETCVQREHDALLPKLPNAKISKKISTVGC